MVAPLQLVPSGSHDPCNHHNDNAQSLQWTNGRQKPLSFPILGLGRTQNILKLVIVAGMFGSSSFSSAPAALARPSGHFKSKLPSLHPLLRIHGTVILLSHQRHQSLGVSLVSRLWRGTVSSLSSCWVLSAERVCAIAIVFSSCLCILRQLSIFLGEKSMDLRIWICVLSCIRAVN